MPLSEYDIENYTNKYGDIVIKIDSEYDENVENKHDFEDLLKDYDPKVGYILHIHGDVKLWIINSFPKGEFKYITTRNGMFVYGNDRVIEKSPLLVDEETSGSITVLTVEYENTKHIVFVKDRTKNRWTNPAGTRDLNESFEECSSRECWEETGIRPSINLLKQVGCFDFSSRIFEVDWPGKARVFMTPVIHTSDEEFNALLNFECDEISDVYCIPIILVDNKEIIDWESTIINDGHLLSEHHKLCADYVISKGTWDWEKQKPEYLTNFSLF
jgi:8-oxo-dGTP pyrophosphatase MutT (NUDIX family)